ncbi:hypothetical protein LB507_005565, partial [Fusarium sp. FIESC RH6]
PQGKESTGAFFAESDLRKWKLEGLLESGARKPLLQQDLPYNRKTQASSHVCYLRRHLLTARPSEHIKRCHTPEFWCDVCLHKFNCSLPPGPLRLAKQEHKRTQCPGESSEENRKMWADSFVMSQEQYERFKGRRWKKTEVSKLVSKKETVAETTWMRIRETIFPGSEAGALSEERFQAAQPPNLDNNIYPVDQIVSEREERSPTVQASLPTINSYPHNHIASDPSQLVPLQSDSDYQSMKRDTKEYLLPGVPEEGLIQANVKEAE